MSYTRFPTIDTEATGRRIASLRKQKGFTVSDLRDFLGLTDVRAIYKWQTGQCLPSIDNLYALSILLNTPIDEILIGAV